MAGCWLGFGLRADSYRAISLARAFEFHSNRPLFVRRSNGSYLCRELTFGGDLKCSFCVYMAAY